MARRKLNIRFILILGLISVVIASVITGLIFGRDLLRPSIASLEKRGDEAFASGDYEQAAELLGRAAFRARVNIPLQIKFVNAFEYTVRGDPEKMRMLRGYYNTIFQTDPNNIEIVRKILRVQMNDAQAAPDSRPVLRALAETADRLLQLVPGDRDARKAKIVTVLEPYQRNQDLLVEQLNSARTDAEKLYEEQPTDGEVMLMLIRFHLKEARDASMRGDNAQAAEVLEKLKKFVEQAVDRTPDNPEAHFAAFNAYRAISALGFNLSEQARRGFLEQAAKHLQQADELAVLNQFPDSERFLNIRAFAIRQLELSDREQAEKRYRRLIDEMPDSRWPRLLLAQFLSKLPNRTEDAIAILSSPWQPTKPLRAIESMQQQALWVQEQLRLSAILLASVKQLSPDERDKRLAQVESIYTELSAIPNPQGILVSWLKRIQGGLALERGKISEAIERLDEALKLLPADSSGQAEADVRNEVLLEYANAHLRLNQTGKARPALEELVTRDPLNMNAAITLIQVLQSDRQFPEAEKRLQTLERYLGKENPVVQTLWNRQLEGQTDALRERYATLPETTPQQILIKLDAAGRLGDLAEQERLARAALAQTPGNVRMSLVLAQVLIRQDRRDEAQAVLAAAEKQSPNDPQIKSLREQLAAQTPDAQRRLLEQRVQDITDPYERELTRAELSRIQGDSEEALKALKKAEEIKPTDPRAIVGQFELLLSLKRPSEARQAYDKLAKLPNYDDAELQTQRIRLMVAEAADIDPEQRQQKLNEALTEASRVAQRYPEIAGPALLYARLLQDSGNYSDALEQFQQVLDKQPSNIEANRGVITNLVRLSRFTEARNRLQSALRLIPNDPVLQQMELTLELEHGDPRRVIGTLTTFRDQNPNNPQAWVQLGYALERAASFAEKKKEVQTAVEFQQQAIDVWKSATEKFPNDLRLVATYADALRRSGDPSGAEAVVEKLYRSSEGSNRPEVVELLATQYQQSNKPQQAEAVLTEFLQRANPTPTSTLIKLALLYVEQQRLPDALVVLDRKKDDPEVRRTLIELLVMAGDLESAKRSVEEALAKKSTPELNLLAGFIALRSGQIDQADGFLAKVLKERPTDSAALFYRAQVRLNSVPSDLQGAKDDLQRVLNQNPGNIEARLVLSDLLARQNQRDASVRQLEEAWRYNTGSKPVLLKLVQAYLSGPQPRRTEAQRVIDQAKQTSEALAKDSDVLFAEANVQLALNQSRKAIELSKQALGLSPDNPVLQQQYFDILLRAGSARDLIRESESVLQKDRGAWWLYRLRGIAYRQLDQRTEALKEFDAALNLVWEAQDELAIQNVVRTIAQTMGTDEAIRRLQPLTQTDISAKLLLAILYQQANDHTRALDVLERVKTDLPRLREDQKRVLWQSLGVSYLQAVPPAPDKSRQAYLQLLPHSPNDMLLLNNLAYVCTIPESGGSFEEALQYSTRAYQLAQNLPESDPSVPYVLDTHGWTLVKNGKLLEGLELLKQAARQAKFPEVFLHLAEAHMINNDLDQAQTALEDARSLIESMENRKMVLDPSIRPRLDRLSADLAQKRPSSPVG